MARYRKKRRSGGKAKSIPMAIVAPLAFDAVLVGKTAMAGDWNGVGKIMTGYDAQAQSFNVNELLRTYAPLGIGIVVHKVANKTGVNSYVRRASMGFLSI